MRNFGNRYSFQPLDISASLKESGISRAVPARMTSIIYNMLFNSSYRVPSVYRQDLLAYDITNQITLPKHITLDDVISTFVNLNISSLGDVEAKGDSIDTSLKSIAIERIEQDPAISDDQRAYFVKVFTKEFESGLSKHLSNYVKDSILRLSLNYEQNTSSLAWLRPSSVTLSSTMTDLNSTRKFTQMILEGIEPAAIVDEILTIRKQGGSIVASVLNTLDVLNKSEQGIAMYPAHYVHSTLFSSLFNSEESRFVASPTDKHKAMFKWDWTDKDSLFRMKMMTVSNEGFPFDDINFKHVTTLVEAIESIFLYHEDHKAIIKAEGVNEIMDALKMMDNRYVRPFISETGLSSMMPLISKMHWLFLTDRVFKNQMSDSGIPVEMYYSKTVNFNSLIPINDYLSAVNTIYETFIEAVKFVCLPAVGFLKKYGAIDPMDPMLASLPDMSFNHSTLQEMSVIETDRNQQSIDKKFSRYLSYRKRKSETFYKDSENRTQQRQVLWPFDDVSKIANIMPNLEQSDVIQKPYNPFTQHMVQALDRNLKGNWSEDLSKLWTFVKMNGYMLPSVKDVSILSPEIPVMNIGDYQASIPEFEQPLFYFYTHIEEPTLVEDLIGDRLDKFMRIFPMDVIQDFQSSDKNPRSKKATVWSRLQDIPYEIKHIATADEFFSQVGGWTDPKTFVRELPNIAKYYFTRKGDFIPGMYWIVAENPFDEAMVVVDDSIVHYNDFGIIANSDLFLLNTVGTKVIKNPITRTLSLFKAERFFKTEDRERKIGLNNSKESFDFEKKGSQSKTKEIDFKKEEPTKDKRDDDSELNS